MDIDHPDTLEFVTTPRHELPWVKRCVDLDNEKWQGTDKETRDAIILGIKSGDIWLNKIKHDNNGKRIYGNVCLEVYLPSRGTCLLQHINLGACTVANIPEAFSQCMSELCNLHGRTGVGGSGEYLPPETDRQVGLGLLGLANLLRRYQITYGQFGQALEEVNSGLSPLGKAGMLAAEFYKGIQRAATVARNNNMDRAFAIAPTASCSYRYRDLDGYTCTPEIAPPIAREVDRDSGTFGVQSYNYGPVEIASRVGWDAYLKVVNGIVKMMDKTGLLHGYSFNSWSDVVAYDNAFVQEWLNGPQTSLYYSLQVMDDTQDKTDAYAALDQVEVDDYLEELLAPQCDCGE